MAPVPGDCELPFGESRPAGLPDSFLALTEDAPAGLPPLPSMAFLSSPSPPDVSSSPFSPLRNWVMPLPMSRISVDGLGSNLRRLTTDSQAGMNADGIPPVM